MHNDLSSTLRRHLALIRAFIAASLQEAAAYRANFATGMLHSLLNLATGVLGVSILFSQIEAVRGWRFASTLAVLGVYLTVTAIRGLFISPSLDSLTGMDGAVWQGTFDFTLLRPVDTQFLASVRHWRPFALVDLILGLGTLAAATGQMDHGLAPAHVLAFLTTLAAALLILYAILLIFAGLVFWSPGFLFTWIFDGLFQMARYPVGLYPGALRLMLTWIVPVGVITTVPAEALAGTLPAHTMLASLLLAVGLVVGASHFFRRGLQRYASASS